MIPIIPVRIAFTDAEGVVWPLGWGMGVVVIAILRVHKIVATGDSTWLYIRVGAGTLLLEVSQALRGGIRVDSLLGWRVG